MWVQRRLKRKEGERSFWQIGNIYEVVRSMCFTVYGVEVSPPISDLDLNCN